MKQNWKTTTAAIAAIIAAVAAGVAAYLDGDASTIADFGAMGAAILAGFGLIFAKDASD
tara:strand:+ start:472 stop:648 length:177 start_codon:yes stop_codon:yes gene_type:complete